MPCSGHCWVRQYVNGTWVYQCINCPETKPA